MTISTGDTLPEATLVTLTSEGPAQVSLKEKTAGRKVVIFGLPGAFTGVCSTAHVPSFMRNMDALKAKGVDEVICISVNDPFVLGAWSESTGGGAAGITFLGDAAAELTKAMGLDFTAPPAGLINRSKRYALMAEDGVIQVLNIEDSPGTCNISAGEAMVEAI